MIWTSYFYSTFSLKSYQIIFFRHKTRGYSNEFSIFAKANP